MAKSIAKKIANDIDEAIEEVVHELQKAGEHVGEEAKDNLSRAAAQLSHAARAFAEEARKQSKAVAGEAVSEVRDHPIAAAAIAAAAAALVGLLIVRRAQPTT